MLATIVGGPNDGERISITEDLPTIAHRGKMLARHEIVIKGNSSREEFVLYTSPELDLPDIFRMLVMGYRR